ncbi:PREDICTED: uncharacterized protein LOC104821419 [Tarenaya hassleriana]|uniref:uncharacterized protein LOC104821419 n=1 Tax=Tarenaya hassleriana TaxID=28532 RepID=UPI00053C3562|nr:PREDICTED: uncharacterized protein LOC104821419 [Tarenaya hassleriana]
MANTLFHLLVIFLSLSPFFMISPSNASRVGSFIERTNNVYYQPQQDTLLGVKEKRREEEEHGERMMVELDDYPGSGANNRHVPRQQFGRGCIDC